MMGVIGRVFSPVRWLVTLEIGIWRSLFLLVTRRVSGQGPGVQAFSYAKAITPIMGAFVFVSALELPVVDLLLPWETVRLIAIVLSVWGLLWMVGLLASMKVFPHLVDDHGLRIRYGTRADIRIPWEAIASVATRRGRVPTRKHVQLERSDDGTVVDVAVLKLTNVEVALHGATTIGLPDGPEEVIGARFYVDDPRGLVSTVRERLDRKRRSEATSSSGASSAMK
jgi:hypothetical protein